MRNAGFICSRMKVKMNGCYKQVVYLSQSGNQNTKWPRRMKEDQTVSTHLFDLLFSNGNVQVCRVLRHSRRGTPTVLC